jgi:hypothetical protein
MIQEKELKINNTGANSDGAELSSPARTTSLSTPLSMRVKFNLLNKSCATRTVPDAKTESIGLQVNAQLSWFLHATWTISS